MGYKRQQERRKRHARGEFDTPENRELQVKRANALAEKLVIVKPRWTKPEHRVARLRRERWARYRLHMAQQGIAVE